VSAQDDFPCVVFPERETGLNANSTSAPVPIYAMDCQVPTLSRKQSRGRFMGAAIDTGAERSIIGIRQAENYCRETGRPLKLTESNLLFRFGDAIPRRSLRTLPVCMPTPDGALAFSADVVDAEVPLLLGMDTLDKHRLQLLTVSNCLEQVGLDGNTSWRIPVTRIGGHAYIEFGDHGSTVFYTQSQLERLHKHL
jgi:hypothetical protein